MSQNQEQIDSQHKQDSTDLYSGISPEELQAEVERIKLQYPEASDFSIEYYDYYDSTQLCLTFYRNETETETQARILYEKENLQRQNNYELKQYEYLKKKFEG